MKQKDAAKIYYDLIRNLDDDSTQTVNTILSRIYTVVNSNKKRKVLDIFTLDEKKQIFDIENKLRSNIFPLKENQFIYNKYSLPVNHFESCVFIDKHHIDKVNQDYFKDKDIIDAGAFVGDSAIVLSEYTNKNVYSFEPTSKNYSDMLKTIEMNSKTNIVPINKGLGDKEEEIVMNINSSASGILSLWEAKETEKCQITTLDKFVEENKLNVGLIKTDLEGCEQKFLKGAMNTIKTQRPVLLISIYHTASDFFDIKPMIESWNLNYKFKIEKPASGAVLLETLLICEPQ